MKPVYETCQPRSEVLSGEIRGEIFAANLSDVVRGEAPDIYGDPDTFFCNTYDTDDLKTFLKEVFERLSGSGPGTPFLRLETSFGGGKTHNLIAAYHIAKDAKQISGVDRFLPSAFTPREPVNVAAVVGDDVDPMNGVDHDGTVIRTLWGEIAYQLGGPEGYAYVAESDRLFGAPGRDALANMVGDKPTLIMIDELAAHLRVARKREDLHEQVPVFLGRLIELACSRQNLVLVITLAESQDAFGRESDELREYLSEAESLSARRELSLKPTREDEIASVINHRLFESIDRAGAEEAAKEFLSYYRKQHQRGVAIPTHATTAEYGNEIQQTYPLHPALLDVLNRKTSTIPNFHKTRGVLRLLARVVRRVWDEKDPDVYIISPAHVDLSVAAIREEVTSRLKRSEFVPVIQADIWSEKGAANPAHAQQVDTEWQDVGKPPLAKRLTQTIFLHSLTHGKATWATRSDINLAVGRPGLDLDLIEQTLQKLGRLCWHMHQHEEEDSYRFDTEPTPEKIIAEEMDKVGRAEGKKDLEVRIREMYQTRFFEPVFFPEEPDDVEDDAGRPKLAIMSYDSVRVKADDAPPPPLVQHIYQHKGTQRGFRTYQNNVLFLCASEDEIENMIRVARRLRAIERITGSRDRMDEFGKKTQAKLKDEKSTADLGVRVAVAKGYRHLFYPDGGAGRESGGLGHYAFKPHEGGTDAAKDTEGRLIRVLRQTLRKALAADDESLGASYVKEKLWPGGTDHMSTEDFRRLFCKNRSMPIILVPDKLKQTVRDGIEKGVWAYWDGKRGYAQGHALPAIALTEDHAIYLPEAAPFCLKCGNQPCTCEVKKVCPRCGQDPCVCEELCPRCGQKPCVCQICPICGQPKPCGCDRASVGPFEGTPNKVFAELTDRCQDAGIECLEAVRIVCDDVDTLRRLGLAFSQLAGQSLSVSHEYTAEAEDGHVQHEYRGSWARFDSSRSFTESFARQATAATQRTLIEVVFDEPAEIGGKQLTRMLESFNTMEVGKIELTGRPAGAEDEKKNGD